jgi:hypothetical protein
MPFTLHCPHCSQEFSLSWDSDAVTVLERVAQEGPWSSVGDGATWEDHVSTVLAAEESMRCPECGEHALVSEESLSRFTQEMLAQW